MSKNLIDKIYNTLALSILFYSSVWRLDFNYDEKIYVKTQNNDFFLFCVFG